MEQSERTATLDKFRRNEIALLVCSDVAARGLDIDAVSHVFNFDVPFNAEDYVHRIGRTARAGLSGTAYTLVTPDDSKQVAAIEHLIKKTLDRENIEGLGEPHEEERHHHRHRGNDKSRDRRHGRDRDSSPPPRNREPSPPLSAPRHAPQEAPRAKAPPRQASDDAFDDSALPAFLRRPPAVVKAKE